MENQVCICGAGTMGRGIALASIAAGMSTVLYDLNPEILHTAKTAIEKELDTDLDKKRITQTEKENRFQRIQFSNQLSSCQARVIIEAIIENEEAKASLFRNLESMNSPETIFVTNTSSLSVTKIASHCTFPERIIGLHFFNPANRMKLVELIPTRFNIDPLIREIKKFAQDLKKTVVVCRDDPGFIVNHVARPFYLEALRTAEKNLADYSTIDRLMESAGFKMGPFRLMDLIGNDINYTVSSSIYEALGKPARLKPSLIQEVLVKQGRLGKKSGAGYFSYDKSTAG